MHIICLDTTQMDARCAVFDTASGECLLEYQLDGKTQKAEKLLPAIEEVIDELSICLDRIIAVTGPGVFTGIRVGLSIAKGLGAGLNIPILGVSVFDLMKIEVSKSHSIDTNSEPFHAFLPARGEGFYYRSWQQLSIEPVFLSPLELENCISTYQQDKWLIMNVDHKIRLLDKGISADQIRLIEKTDLKLAAEFAASIDPTQAPCDALYIREADAAVGKSILTFAAK